MTTPTDRQRMEEYRAEMNRLRSTLKLVAAQRDTLASCLLNYNVEAVTTMTIRTILTDLVESGHITDVHGFLS